ncbi:ABC transporter permease subunit [Castellaniella denitrificans]|uniref:branched-chain amino acid ABC transporter ATP-binding protein/permease n=1 Tax=Castellaniella denitrificans TaxID=56119 RepID=UPI001ACC2092|nr:branched-chain amino acid ABC transporter ATP-binding protein/permease [Burkholderiales bacterium]
MNYWANVVNIILIYSILGISLNLVLGFSGMISMAHAVYFGIAAYTVALLTTDLGMGFMFAAVIAIALTGLFAAITAFPALRVRDEYLILLTLALQMIASGILDGWVSVTGGPSGIPGIPPIEIGSLTLFDPTQLLPALLLVTLVVFLIASRITHSPFGRALKAMRENESAAIAAGKNVISLKVIVFGVSGVIAGIAGALFASAQGFIDPLSFNLDTSILAIALVALGGAANLYGTLVGAVLILGLPEVLTFFDIGSTDVVSASRGIIFGLLLMLFARFRPQGLVPERSFSETLKAQPGSTVASTQTSGPAAARPPAGQTHASLEVTNLNKWFGGIVTAKDVNLVLKPGQVTALIGPNGAGKTTIFNLLAGVIRPNSGHITVGGVDITDMPAWKRVSKGIGRSFQDVRIFENISVIDNVLVALPNQPGENLFKLLFQRKAVRTNTHNDHAYARQLLAQVGLQDKAQDSAGDLSYGEQKLLAIARLVATGADILLFDEPAAGVDAVWAARMIEIIRSLAQSGKTICLVEHNLNVVKELADTVYFMNVGNIVTKGTPDEIMRNPELAELYFGQEAIKD